MRGVKEHINYTGGTKTVCVSHCLATLGIAPHEYNYTSSKTNRFAYRNVLRRFGYSVCSRATELKLKKHKTTLSELKSNLRKSGYGESDRFLVCVVQSKSAHLILLNGNADVLVDTAPKCRWRVERIDYVNKS